MIQNASIANDISSLILKLTTNCQNQQSRMSITMSLQLFHHVKDIIRENGSSSATNIFLLEELELVNTRMIRNHDLVGSFFDIKMISATLRQVTMSPNSLTNSNSLLNTSQTSLLNL